MTDDEEFDRVLQERAQHRFNEATRAMLDAAPPDDEHADALVASVLAREGKNPPAQDAAPPDEPPRRIRWLVPAVAMAAAAVLVGVIAWPRSAPNALPGFTERTFEGGRADVRSDPAAPRTTPAFFPATHLRWRAAPRSAVEEGIAVRVHAVGRAELCVEPREGLRVAQNGSVELDGPIGPMLGLDPGEWTLTLLVATHQTMEESTTPCATDRTTGEYAAGVVPVAAHAVTLLASP